VHWGVERGPGSLGIVDATIKIPAPPPPPAPRVQVCICNAAQMQPGAAWCSPIS
jgi:hypothetical protein